MKKVAIVGAGNVGLVLAIKLQNNNYHIYSAFTRKSEKNSYVENLLHCPVYNNPEEAVTGADIVFITTPDSVIEETCQAIELKDRFTCDQLILHTSGAHSSDILSSARKKGCRVLSFHPLQTFPNLESGLAAIPGTYFTVEGDETALEEAARLIEALEGKLLSIPTELKPLYHAAASVACNYLVSLMDISLAMFTMMNIPREEAFAALTPLVERTIGNLKTMTPEKALTGPIARGDITTIKAHLKILSEHAPELITVYKSLGIHTTQLASGKETLDKREENILMELFK